MITVSRIQPGIDSLGGAQFQDSSGRHFLALVAGESGNQHPIELRIGASGIRSVLDMSIAEAEAMIACVAEAVRLRRDGEAKATAVQGRVVAMETRRLRAFFDDPDGPLERV